jgi:hypothetical protein
MHLFYHFKFRLSTAKSQDAQLFFAGIGSIYSAACFAAQKTSRQKAGGFLIITREAADSARSSVCRISVYSDFCQNFYQSTPMQSLAIASAS